MGERLKLNSVSGNVVSFDTDLEKNLGSLKIGIEPVQEGSGDPSPDNVRPINGWTGANVTRTGKNMFNYDSTKATTGITTAGTTRAYYPLEVSNCTLSFSAELVNSGSVTTSNINIGMLKGGKLSVLNSFIGSGITERTITFSENEQAVLMVSSDSLAAITINFPKYRICVTTGSTPQSYEPYVGTTYPITLPSAAGTVYGGELDVTKGILTVDRVIITPTDVKTISDHATSGLKYWIIESGLGSINLTNDNKSRYASNIFVPKIGVAYGHFYITAGGKALIAVPYAEQQSIDNLQDASAWINSVGAQFVYPLATPVTYSLTPTEISTLLGANTLYADCGPIQEASYFSRDYVPVTSDTGLITITDGVEAPIDSLKIHFEPVQEGSGDPSPENVRPISGWSGVNIWRNSKNFIDFSAPILPPNNINGGTAQKRKFTPGTWAKGVAHNNYYDPTRGNITIYNDHVVINSRVGYGAGFALALPQGETFYINAKISLPNYRIYAVMYASDGTHMGYKLCMFQSSSMEYTVPNGCAITVFEFLTFDPEETGIDCTVSNIQIEHNSTITSYKPYTGQTYPITFPSEAGTVYGGYVDVAKGELVANKVGINLGSLNYSKDAAGYFQTAPSELTLNDARHYASSTKPNILCAQYKTMTVVQVTDNDNAIGMYWYSSGNRNILRIRDNRFLDSTASEFKQAMDGVMVIYPLATPITYSLTPTQLSTIKGLNNIYSNANGAIEMSYYSPVKENILSARRRSFAWDYKTYIASHPAVLQKLCSTGKASNYFKIGDEIIIPWTDNSDNTPITYQYPFVVTHFGNVYDENGNEHENGMWLMAKYATPNVIVFDAPESTIVDLTQEPNALAGWYYWGVDGSTYTELHLSTGDPIPTTYASVAKCGINNVSVLRYGYNRWRDSAYRQWLNSDAIKNEGWWTEQHMGDRPPAAAQLNLPGWLNGFTDEWKAIFKPVKVDTACNTVTDGGVTDTTYDTFFLPSLEQMYGAPQAAGVEGDYWEYWKEETGLDAPTNGSSSNTNEARKIPSIANPTGSAVDCRLRSAYRGVAHSVWYVYAAGYLYGNGAGALSRALPACVIY